MNPWINGTVLMIKKWTNNLFSLFLDADISPFYAGQFTQLALYNEKNEKIQRAYSFVNAPGNKSIEIYINRVLNGKFSNYLYNLKIGDTILIKKKSFGFFTMNEVPTSKQLWMFATGTAIGPYCSILQDNKNIDRFQDIILIHAVRYQHELIYLPLIKKICIKMHGKLKIQTIISRENHHSSLHGRIPYLLQNEQLEKTIGYTINKKNSHVMLCGNPNMVKETFLFLKNIKHMRKNLRKIPGHITMENYW
ncbi:FAD-binding oxidoreductase [Buchnera aphidicola]|uniref:FAD-binding oxidoreductase n=1 Tax=Buchnera aphidicola TaxID=9 RepID=UPI003463EE9B